MRRVTANVMVSASRLARTWSAPACPSSASNVSRCSSRIDAAASPPAASIAASSDRRPPKVAKSGAGCVAVKLAPASPAPSEASPDAHVSRS